MFEPDFDPAAYLAEYYSRLDAGPYWHSPLPLATLGQENSCLLEFYARIVLPAIQQLRFQTRLLEVGGGPVIYQLISPAVAVEEIFFTDYLQQNLELIQKWREGSDGFWHRYIGQALAWEADSQATTQQTLAREQLIKLKLRLAQYDVLNDVWLSPEPGRDTKFDVVCSNFCLESITDLRWQWRAGLANLASLVSPAGLLVMTALEKSLGYRVGQRIFPAVSIQADDIRTALRQEGFEEIQTWTKRTAQVNSGYGGLIFTLAERGR